jgi:hypothetical protein
MMKRMLIAAAAAWTITGTHAQLNPASATWSDFLASSDAHDRKLAAEVQKRDWWLTCAAWGQEARSRKNLRRMYGLQAFLLHEKNINGIDVGRVATREVEIGMTFCGVVATLGMPDRLNQTETATRHRSQMVYRSRGLYVYVEGSDANGIVRTIQR